MTGTQAGEVTRPATSTVADVLAWLGIDDVEVTALVERQVGELTR